MSEQTTGYVMRVDVFGFGDGVPGRRVIISRDVNCWGVFYDEEPPPRRNTHPYYADSCVSALGAAWKYIETGVRTENVENEGRR